MYSLRGPRFRGDPPPEIEPASTSLGMWATAFILILAVIGSISIVVFGIGMALREVVPAHGKRSPVAEVIRR